MFSKLLPVVLLLLSSPVAAQDGRLADALEAGGPAAVERALAAELSEAERRLAEGALAAMLNRDADAEALLAATIMEESLDMDLRRRAAQALSGVRLRTGDFAGAADALQVADTISPLDASARQAMAFADALRGAPRIAREDMDPGRIPLSRDMAELTRAEASINGRAQEAVVDTGAGYSTVTESTAERLGLSVFEAEVSVGAAAMEAVASRLALADAVELGGARFRNVIFIVVPDEALSFADGLYTIEAIIGFPVLTRLERLVFQMDAHGEWLTYGPSQGGGAGNLFLDGLSPVVLAEAEGAEAPLRLMLDTGAHVTNLSRKAMEDHPALAAAAVARAGSVGGAGGSAVEEDALAIPSLTLRIAETPVTLSEVMVFSAGEAGRRHGLLGQDALRAGRGFVIDFAAMSFELLPAGADD